MAVFTYKTRSGLRPLEGQVEAVTPAEAIRELSLRGIFPTEINRQDAATAVVRLGRVPLSAMAASLRELADLLQAGLPLATVLQMAAQQAGHPRLVSILTDLSNGVREGQTLSGQMQKHPEVFPVFYRQMIRAGEAGGMLAASLARLADQAEKEDEIRSQLKTALAYPIFILSVGVLTVGFLLGAIIPKLSALFSEFQQMLPWPTRILLVASDLFRNGGWLMFPILALVGWNLRGRSCPVSWRHAFDRFVVHFKLTREWVATRELAQFARTLGSLLENGVPILGALQVSASTLTNEAYRNAVLSLEEPVRQGRLLSWGMRRSSLFPRYVANLVAVGEEGGRLSESLLKIAQVYERQGQRAMKIAMALLEPMLILVVGLVLGLIVIAVLLPMFEINTMVR